MTKQVKIFLSVAVILIIGGGLAIYFSLHNSGGNYQELNNQRPWTGKEDAKVVVVEYSDFQCPACKAADNTLQQVISKYKDKVRFEYKHFPLSSIHPRAFAAAEASECANDQGKFWEYHDKLFASQPNFRKSELISYAKDLGLDVDKFTACLDSDVKKDIVRSEYDEAMQKNLPGTPSFFINGKKLENWNLLEQEIKKALETNN